MIGHASFRGFVIVDLNPKRVTGKENHETDKDMRIVMCCHMSIAWKLDCQGTLQVL